MFSFGGAFLAKTKGNRLLATVSFSGRSRRKAKGKIRGAVGGMACVRGGAFGCKSPRQPKNGQLGGGHKDTVGR